MGRFVSFIIILCMICVAIPLLDVHRCCVLGDLDFDVTQKLDRTVDGRN